MNSAKETSAAFFARALAAPPVNSDDYPLLNAELQEDGDTAVSKTDEEIGPADGLYESFNLIRPTHFSADEIERAAHDYCRSRGCVLGTRKDDTIRDGQHSFALHSWLSDCPTSVDIVAIIMPGLRHARGSEVVSFHIVERVG
jgi:hypothetical protein